jgi:hypothetical protein
MGYITIEIYCDDSSWHPGKRCEVRTFARTAPCEWTPLDWLDPEVKRRLWLPADAHVPLDVATNRDLRKDWFKLACRKCRRRGRYRRRGEFVLEVRDTTLGGILESEHDTGESSISLADLAAKLRGSAGT